MLIAIGVSHKTAPIEVREKLAFSPEHIPNALKLLAQQIPLEEVVLLSTCNRTEFYCSINPLTATWQQEILDWWQQFLATPFEVTPYSYFFSEDTAVKHLMRVASGLDSMVLGEPQIFGQLKTAFHTAIQNGVMGKRLSRLFQTSFSVAKRIRSTTGISSHPVSVAFAAVSLAKQIFRDLTQATVLLIGAGENIELTIQHLLEKKVKQILIVNRTLSHAQRLAERYGAQALSLDHLEECLALADIVLSSVDCVQPVLRIKHFEQAFERRRRPIFIVDLGVPRNVEPLISKHEDIYLYTIDDLEGIIQDNLKNRQFAALEAEIIISSACHAFMHWLAAQHKMHQVRALRKRAQEIKAEALNIALRQLERGVDPKQIMAHLAHRLTQKLMHDPTVNLRQLNLESVLDTAVVPQELINIE